MNGAELIFRHCLPHSLLTLIVLFILRRMHRQSSRTAYGICIILLLGLLIPVKIQLPVSSKIVEPVRSLPLSEVWIASQTPDSSVMSTASESNPSEPGMNGTQIVTLLWLGGCAVALGINLIRNRESLKYIRRWSRLAGSAELESLRQLQSQMKLKRHIRLMMCRGIATPCALGLIHPTLILPEQDWEKEELTLVLTHELIHIRRYDSWIRLLSVIARVVYWFNPIVYLLEIQMNQYCEQACDEAVIQNCTLEQRQRYGSLLLRQARSSHSLPILSTGFMLKPKQLQERLMRVMNQKQFKMNWEKVLIVAALVIMAGCVMKEKEIRNFLATPLANAKPENHAIYLNSDKLQGYRKQAEFEETFILENKDLSLNQFREKMENEVESLRTEGFALDSLVVYPNRIQQIVLPRSVTISSIIYDSKINKNRRIDLSFIFDGDNDKITYEQSIQMYVALTDVTNDYFDNLSESQKQAFLYEDGRESALSFIEQKFEEQTKNTMFSIRQLSFTSVEIDENLPSVNVQLNQTLEELRSLSYDEIMALAQIEEGPSYTLITADGINIHGIGIGFYQPISSICKNEEARISAQAYVKFYENGTGIQDLQEIPDLINKVDQIINDRLHNLQEEDHSMLSENLRKRIVEELNVENSLIWVDVIKD